MKIQEATERKLRDVVKFIGKHDIEGIETNEKLQCQLLESMITEGKLDSMLNMNFAGSSSMVARKKANNILYYYGISKELREILDKTKSKISNDTRLNKATKKGIKRLYSRHGIFFSKAPILKGVDVKINEIQNVATNFIMKSNFLSIRDTIADLQREIESGRENSELAKSSARTLLFIIATNLNKNYANWSGNATGVDNAQLNQLVAAVQDAYLTICELFKEQLPLEEIKRANEENIKRFQNPDGAAIGTEISEQFVNALEVIDGIYDALTQRLRNVRDNEILRTSLVNRRNIFTGYRDEIKQIEEIIRGENVNEHNEYTTCLKDLLKLFNNETVDVFSGQLKDEEACKDMIAAIDEAFIAYRLMLKNRKGTAKEISKGKQRIQTKNAEIIAESESSEVEEKTEVKAKAKTTEKEEIKLSADEAMASIEKEIMEKLVVREDGSVESSNTASKKEKTAAEKDIESIIQKIENDDVNFGLDAETIAKIEADMKNKKA